MRIRVKVARIEAMHDPQGRSGVRIDFLEEFDMPRVTVVKGDSEEARMVQNVLSALSQSGLPFFQQQTQFAVPRLVLFLRDDEKEALGMRFEAGHFYDLVFEDGAVRFVEIS